MNPDLINHEVTGVTCYSTSDHTSYSSCCSGYSDYHGSNMIFVVTMTILMFAMLVLILIAALR